ncbi:MAG: hydrogenase maturation protease [Verrucomicrobia bacterium]|nr:hydrogenase maturation protease [Verrucomicrobiota bacterium]
MPDLREQLEPCFAGRVCLMGLGNTGYSDDGFGVRLAEALAAAGVPDVIIAGTTPDRFLGRVAAGGFDVLIFLDAVEFGGAPGSVVFLNAGEMTARFPQISTHKISLGTLAKWVEAGGSTRARLLGVQPQSLKPGTTLTATVRHTLDALTSLLVDAMSMKPKALDCCEHRSFPQAETATHSDRRALVSTAVQSLRHQHSYASAAWCPGDAQ